MGKDYEKALEALQKLGMTTDEELLEEFWEKWGDAEFLGKIMALAYEQQLRESP